MSFTAFLLIAMVSLDTGASQQTATYLGRPVAEVLHQVQASGVRFLFSSDLVPASLRVTVEPPTREPRQLARQILAPHGLTLAPGLAGRCSWSPFQRRRSRGSRHHANRTKRTWPSRVPRIRRRTKRRALKNLSPSRSAWLRAVWEPPRIR